MNSDAYWLRAKPAVCKTGLAASRRKMMVHRVGVMISAVQGNRVLYDCKWLCGNGAADAILIADPEPLGGVCVRCDSLYRGPLVYRCFDANGQLIYVGSTMDEHQRMLTHRSRSPWWGEVARIDREHHAELSTARYLEAKAIEAERPLYNKFPGRCSQETASAHAALGGAA